MGVEFGRSNDIIIDGEYYGISSLEVKEANIYITYSDMGGVEQQITVAITSGVVMQLCSVKWYSLAMDCGREIGFTVTPDMMR